MTGLKGIINWLLRKPEEKLSFQIIHGSIWTFATQIFTRTLTFVRTIVLARLLSPNDFGLMGIAFLALSTLQTFSETGVNTALIYKKDSSKEELDVAWSIRLLRTIVIFFLLFFFAPYISSFFNNPKATSIVRFIALGQLFYGLSNIAIIKFQKEIEFHKYFFFSICSTIPEVIVAIVTAIILKNVWALVIGYLVGAVANCIFSYIFCPFKPRFSLEGVHVRGLLGYGKWIWASTVIIFLITQGDDIFVGKFLGATALGLYQLAYRISNLPATEIVHVISRVAFPAYVKARDNIEDLRKLYLNFLYVSTMLSFSFSFVILKLSPLLVKEILGYKWISMIIPLQILCVFASLRSVGSLNGSFFRAMGTPHIETYLSALKLIFLCLLIYPLSQKLGLIGVALATTVPSFIHNTIGTFLIAQKISSFKEVLNKILFSLFLSMLGVLLISIFSKILNIFSIETAIINLLLLCFIGMLPSLYFITLSLRNFILQYVP